jgi:hypothetical protein
MLVFDDTEVFAAKYPQMTDSARDALEFDKVS